MLLMCAEGSQNCQLGYGGLSIQTFLSINYKTCSKYFGQDCLWKSLLKDCLRRNFSLVARYSLKFTHCPLRIVKSLVTRCKIRLLLVAKAPLCKKSLITCCKICLLLIAEVACYKKSLVNHCRSCWLQKITRYSLQNLLVNRCRSCLLQ